MKSRHSTKVANNKQLPQAPSVIVSHDKTFVCQKCDIFEHHYPPPPNKPPQNNEAKILFSSIIQEE